MESKQSTRTICHLPLNRVEGDLEIRLEVADGVVVDAWSSGTLFRGFETLLVGRNAMDSLVITPRICGICSTTHLLAAAMALEEIVRVSPPDNALRVRNVALMAEHLQSDMRQSLLMYTVDFAHATYQGRPWYEEAVKRFAPFRGESLLEVVRETKKILEMVAILGGQWPHSSFMVPGGVVLMPRPADVRQCRVILNGFRKWYEHRILGCSLERWAEVATLEDLAVWRAAAPAHRESDLGWFLHIAHDLGLDRIGGAHGAFLSYGSLPLPRRTVVRAGGDAEQWVAAGFYDKGCLEPFTQEYVAEQVASSWYEDYEGGLHPFKGLTRPQPPEGEGFGTKYSWAKAPRYRDAAPETGPLAEAVIGGSPLFRALVDGAGTSALVRQLARLVRPATLIPVMDLWLQELENHPNGSVYQQPEPIGTGKGFGLIQAARGALGHWVRIKNGVIDRYQIITPTAWNGSPRDGVGQRGPWEEALIGVPVEDLAHPIAAGHVVRSFDPCLVCTVHTVHRGRTVSRARLR
ncbi:MAG: nickel-dependent hydrogenase large subunit [Magnetococcales bacterium]|nr:nickel-dependent hydrogenase large subunit [Magnetococcales bacterium]